MNVFLKFSARIALAMLLTLFALPSYAQTQVSGLVLDQDHEPIVGASVTVKGATAGAATES